MSTESVDQTQPVTFRPIMIILKAILLKKEKYNSLLMLVIASGIDAVITDHLELGMRDMSDQFEHKSEDRFLNLYPFFGLMVFIVISDFLNDSYRK